jgi:hypothetical protein
MLSASSSAQHNPADPKTPDMAVNGIARAWNGRANAWLPAADSISPHWLQLEWETPVSVNLVIVAFQTANLAPDEFHVQNWTAQGWIDLEHIRSNRHRRLELALPETQTRKLRIVLTQPAGICEIRVYNAPKQEMENARRARRNMSAPDHGPGLPWTER